MIREEAIKLIKVAQAEVEWSCPMDYATAFDLAIKALEQEPCDKCEVGNPCLYCKHEFEPQESEVEE